MKDFDRKIKKMSREFSVPQQYHQKVDELLESIREDEEEKSLPLKKYFVRAAGAVVVVCLLFTGYLLFSNPKEAKADFFGMFMQTIVDFFGKDEDAAGKIGIKSEKGLSSAKQDLMIELKEKVINKHNIYLMIQIVAPPEIEFQEKIGFDYFGFCRGANYNADGLLPGVTDCKLLEVLEGRESVASYVVSISTTEELQEEETVCVFFKDLMADPYGDGRQMLVEGMWSVSFSISYTVTDEVTAQGTAETTYPFLGTEAVFRELRLTPLGIDVISDVSQVDYDSLGVSDTNIAIVLQMIDGSKKAVAGSGGPEEVIEGTGSQYVYQEEEQTFIEYTQQFEEPLDISQVIGVYVGDCYVPLVGME